MAEGAELTNGMLEMLIEQLRSPLMQIHLLSQDENAAANINSLTASLIELLDNMQLASFLERRQLELPFEPINLLALAEDAAHKLHGTAAMHGVNLNVKASRCQPIIANRDFLKRAYENMAGSLIDLAQHDEGATITLRADDYQGKTRFGVYSSGVDFAAHDLNKVRKLYGRTSRPIARLSTTPAAQIYIADRLLHSMGTHLRTSIANRERGLATVLTASRQLSLVEL